MLIKRGCHGNNNKPVPKMVQQPKQAMVNWAEYLPPPPEHPPPCNEMGTLTRHGDNRNMYLDQTEVNSERAGGTRSPMSPVSKISSCSCPAPQNMNGGPSWNVPNNSDNNCVRCSSPQYCESWHYNPQHYSIISPRTQSPRGYEPAPRSSESWGQRTITYMQFTGHAQ